MKRGIIIACIIGFISAVGTCAADPTADLKSCRDQLATLQKNHAREIAELHKTHEREMAELRARLADAEKKGATIKSSPASADATELRSLRQQLETARIEIKRLHEENDRLRSHVESSTAAPVGTAK